MMPRDSRIILINFAVSGSSSMIRTVVGISILSYVLIEACNTYYELQCVFAKTVFQKQNLTSQVWRCRFAPQRFCFDAGSVIYRGVKLYSGFIAFVSMPFTFP